MRTSIARRPYRYTTRDIAADPESALRYASNAIATARIKS